MSAVKLVKQARRAVPTAEYTEVTPDLAAEWLDTTRRNRKLNSARVQRYAAMMKRGDWMVSNDAITFDEFGNLSNGQHRLAAIVQSGISPTLLVVRGAPNRSQLVMDMGYKRTPHDQIALRQGWDVLPIHTAILKSMLTSVGGIGERQRKEAITDIQLLDRLYNFHHKTIELVVGALWHGRYVTKGVTIAPVMAPLARAIYTQDKDKVLRFGEVVMTGQADRPGESPAVVLRNYLLAGRDRALSARSGKDRYHIYKKTEIALNAYLKGESIERLGQRVLDVELYPMPRDIKIGKDVEEEGAGE